MSSPTQPHVHGASCGHPAVQHEGHTDYLTQGHLEHQEGGQVENHAIGVNARNPASCTPGFHDGHSTQHHHGVGCGHEAVPHGTHTDYLVQGRLHHAHGDHCDDHGAVSLS
jgi:hypothetical protein